jgi:hypothetical protein
VRHVRVAGGDRSGMEPSPKHRAAEADFRRLLESGGLAQPDLVDYEPDSIVLRWSGPKLAVVVDLETPADAGARGR